MFKLEENPKFTHVVEVLVPADEGHVKQDMKVTFQAIPVGEFGQLDLSSAEDSTLFLQRIVVGVDDVVGPDNKPLPFSAELRDRLIAISYVRSAIVRTYFKAMGKAAEGN